MISLFFLQFEEPVNSIQFSNTPGPHLITENSTNLVEIYTLNMYICHLFALFLISMNICKIGTYVHYERSIIKFFSGHENTGS